MKDEHETVSLFQYTNGPRDARVVLVGEAWGASEYNARQPFVGTSGQELNRMLREAGIPRETVLCCNVISEQPPNNDFTHFLFTNKEVKEGLAGKPYHGIYPKPSLWNSINALWNLLSTVNPDLVLAAGNIPLHILTPHCAVRTFSPKSAFTQPKRSVKYPAGIASWRGSQTYSRDHNGRTYRVLPIIHPASIIREWSNRSITVHDLRSRAGRFLRGDLSWEAPPTNDIWRPTRTNVETLLNQWIAIAHHRELRLSVDIETYQQRYISVLGLGTEEVALCIPFFYFDSSQRCVNYWSFEDEQFIWNRARDLLQHPNVHIVGQNFIYDSQFLKRSYGIDAIVSEDTMVMHHLLYPGTPKALHRLASLYNNHYCYWKDESSEWNASETGAEDLWRYNCKDLRATLEAATLLKALIYQREYVEQYVWRMREWKMARKMSLKGINYDDKLRKQYQREMFTASAELESWLLNCVPESARYAPSGTPWYNSPVYLMDLLYHRLGLGSVLHKTTKRPTSDDSAINELLERRECRWLRPVLERIQALRSVGVFDSHFLAVRLGPDRRLRTQFNIAQPETFRWSSSENPFNEGTNLQNTPKVEVD